DGEGAAVRRVLEFADGGVGDRDGLGQMADEGPEELLADAGGGPFDHRPQRVQVVGYRGGGRPLPRPGRRRARFLTHRPCGVRFAGHGAPPGPELRREATWVARGETTGPRLKRAAPECVVGIFYPRSGKSGPGRSPGTSVRRWIRAEVGLGDSAPYDRAPIRSPE